MDQQPLDNSNGHVTNFQKWRYYNDGLTSPDNYINFGYYFLVSAALQRRVWLPPTHKPIFPNLYIVFVGPPGVGKGLVITSVADILKYHKIEDPYEKKTTLTSTNTGDVLPVDREVIEACAHADYLAAKGEEERMAQHTKNNTYEKPLLIQMAPDATTYEALVSTIAKALRRKNFAETDPITGRVRQKIYVHSSVAFCLEELSSLFRKKTEDVIRFLQITYDCGDFKKDTKTQGSDKIQKCCVSLLGAATQEFMQKLFKDDLANEGYASRTIHVYESRDRKCAAFIPELNELQKQYKSDILDHVKKLANLYGQVEIDKEASEFIEDWHARAQASRPNINEKLQYYYARKKMHLFKLSMAVHFGESLELKLHLPEVKQALVMLNLIEKSMHHALIHQSKNPYYRLSLKIIEFLKNNGRRTRNELKTYFWEDLPTENPSRALDETLEHLQITGKMIVNRDSKTNLVYYELIKEEKPPEEPEII